MSNETIRRELAVEVRVLDQARGIVEYVASDESIDSHREIVRARGWRFTRFEKNAPFLDSHNSYDIGALLGKVVAFEVKGDRLIETVQWAIDVPSNVKARIGWDMTVGGYLKAVSVGFIPVRMATKWDQDPKIYLEQLRDLKRSPEEGVRVIYTEQEQIELSACVIGSNPNALLNVGKAFKAGAITDADLQFLSAEIAKRETPPAGAPIPGHAPDQALAQACQREFVDKIERIIKAL